MRDDVLEVVHGELLGLASLDDGAPHSFDNYVKLILSDFESLVVLMLEECFHLLELSFDDEAQDLDESEEVLDFAAFVLYLSQSFMKILLFRIGLINERLLNFL